MTGNGKVSVIIPAYNAEKTLRKTVESALGQTYTDIEIIVIDDGSTDGTKNSIEDYIASGRVQYFRQTNKGASAARNMGLRKASGDYIAMLDSDDFFAWDKIEKQLKFMKETGADASFTFFKLVRIDGSIIERKYNYQENNLIKTLLREPVFFLSSILLKRSLLEKVGPMDEKLTCSEDWDWFLRMELNTRIKVLEEFLTFKVDISQSLSKRYKRKYDLYIKLYKKYKTILSSDNLREFRMGISNRCYFDAIKLIKSGDLSEGIMAFSKALLLRKTLLFRFHKLIFEYLKGGK